MDFSEIPINKSISKWKLSYNLRGHSNLSRPTVQQEATIMEISKMSTNKSISKLKLSSINFKPKKKQKNGLAENITNIK